MKALESSDSARIVDALLGSCMMIPSALEKLGIEEGSETVTEVEGMLANLNIETCPGCDWWHESSDLVDDDNEPCLCLDCR